MKCRVNLAPGSIIAARAASRIAVILLAASFLFLSVSAWLSAGRFTNARAIDRRIVRMLEETAANRAAEARFREMEPWKGMRSEATAYTAALPKAGHSVPAILSAVEGSIPAGVTLESIRVGRADGSLRIEGVSVAFGGAEEMRAAMAGRLSIPSLAVRSNRYHQGRKLHVFLLSNQAGGR